LPAKVEYKASAEKDLRPLNPPVALRLQHTIERNLIERGGQGIALSGPCSGFYRLRVGDYRVIYRRAAEGYVVVRIGHRREVYRQGPPEI
jgi:mRNA interferase RelE/StbE